MNRKDMLTKLCAATHCDFCGHPFGEYDNRTLLDGRRPDTFLVACDGDKDCPMIKRPWKPVPHIIYRKP